MANKQKLLESAQKNIRKKLLPRAIKDLQKVVELDPRDVRSRQRLAELYVRTHKAGEAFEQYEAVAKYFASNGFYLKAIAIYKQMQRLDPSQIGIFSRLAELNEKQGLLGNALAELRHLVGYYEKNDMVADAIKTLEKMRELDTENLNVQIKLTEIYVNNERSDDGLNEFKQILNQLEKKQDYDKILRLYKMFLPRFPQHKELHKGLALALISKGELTKGITILQTLLRKNPDDIGLISILAKTYAGQGDIKNARMIYLHHLKVEPNDLEARENLIKCYLDEKAYDQALTELEEWKEAFLKINRIECLKKLYESLQSALPENQQVLQTLDSIYEITGDGDKLLDIVAGSSERESIEIVADSGVDETLSDSLLGSMDVDEETPTFDGNLVDGTEVSIPLEEESSELELEPLTAESGEQEEFIELNLADVPADETIALNDELNLDFDLADENDVAAQNVPADLAEAEFYLQQGLFEEAEKVCIEILERCPDNPAVKAELEKIRESHAAPEGQNETSAELLDLATELLEDGFPELNLALNVPEENSVTADGQKEGSAGLSSVDGNLDKTSKVFRTDVDEQIAADDLESHYNLGIAYREMGLYADAIAEFGKAEHDPARFVDCQTLKGLCWVYKGDFEKGEAAFKTALAGDSLDDGQKLSLYYELGVLYEGWERNLEALDSFQFVADRDLSFRDVADRIDVLRATLGLTEKPSTSHLETTGDTPVEHKDRVSFI